MKSWEFLIQKEGERHWQPIKDLTVQLEAGKYRLLAQSNRFNRVVEIRVSSQTRETQQQQRRINSQGLIMVLPFTDFSAGTTWKIRCCGDVLSEFLGETWQEQLTLTILPNSPNPDTLSDESNSPQMTDSVNSQAHYYLQQLEQLLREKIEPQLSNYLEKDAKDESDYDLSRPIINLILETSELTINAGESVNLSGKVEVDKLPGDLALTAKLCYELKDSETEETRFSREYSLSDEKLPYHFKHQLELPPSIKHQSLVGEVRLETTKGFVLTSRPFNLRIHHYHPVNYKIELFDIESQDAYTFDLALAERVSEQKTHLELPNTNKYSRLFPTSFYRSQPILPPKLNVNSHTVRQTHHQLKLPQITY